MAKSLGTKLYYSIGEVAELTELAPYTLRAWESEFACLRPKRVRGKNRAYRRRDIAIILLIRRLLHEERYSTRGAQQKLRNEPDLIRVAVECLEEQPAVSPPSLSDIPLQGAAPEGTPEAQPEGTQSPAEARETADAAPGAGATDPDADRQLLRLVRSELRQILELLRPAS